MTIVRELVGRQKRVVSVEESATVREAAKAMAEANVGCAAVMSQDRLVGLFTERDILKRVLLQDLHTDEVAVSEVMTREIVTCSQDTEVRTARALLRSHHIRHLPIEDSAGKLLGVLSIRDLLREEVAEVRRYLHLEES